MVARGVLHGVEPERLEQEVARADGWLLKLVFGAAVVKFKGIDALETEVREAAFGELRVAEPDVLQEVLVVWLEPDRVPVGACADVPGCSMNYPT